MLQTFIKRPILSAVIAIVIVLLGVLSLISLPISQYPDVVPPTITVSAFYPGASADIVQKTVAVPLEEQINGVDNMMYMTSSCANDGSMSITVYFEVGTNPDMATVNVQNRVQRAMSVLPSAVIQGGVIVAKKSPSFLVLYSLYSENPDYDSKFLNNYCELNIVNVLKRVPGVGDVHLFGGDNYSLRIWLDPQRMASMGISTQDVQNAIQDQNIQCAPGQIGQEPAPAGQEATFTISVEGRFSEVDEFEDIVVKANSDGSMVKLKDIAKVELGMQSYSTLSRMNGKTTTIVQIYQSPGSNAMAVKEQCDQSMQEIAKGFPNGIKYNIGLDTVAFVKASIEEVLKTLIEAFILVFIVVFLFLQDWRATLIPAVTVPVSLIGSLAAFQLLGFSINMMTLFGLVLAIGIVVDDAIVVLEAVQEKIDHKGMSPLEATKETMSEITGAIFTITLVLTAVFVPVSFLGGTTGQMYKQFALTLSSSILISALCAVTLSPALCVLLLKPKRETKGLLGRFFKGFEKYFEKFQNKYSRTVTQYTAKIKRPVILLITATVLMVLLMKYIPGGFLPDEDQGYFFINIESPDALSLGKTDAIVKQVETILSKTDGVQNYVAVTGFSILSGAVSTSNAMVFVSLKPWDERTSKDLAVKSIIGKVQAQMNKIPGATFLAFNAPAISGVGNAQGLEFHLQDKSGLGGSKLSEVSEDFIKETKNHKELVMTFSSLKSNVPQYYLDIDKDKAKTLGVPLSQIYLTLQSYIGSLYVNDFNKFGKSYRVVIQAEGSFRATPDDIEKIYVKSNSGNMIPLGTLASLSPVSGTDILTRFNLFSSADITIINHPLYSSGQAIEAVKEAADKSLPFGFGYEYGGLTRQEILAGNQAPFIFALCLLFVYLLLAAKYESWLLPIPILLTLPFGIFGALAFQIFLWLITTLFGGSGSMLPQFNLYAQIGMIMLIGLVAKNAILIVEFARQKHEEGLDVVQAAIEGAKLRFRPILMTSFAFILGVLPLVTATGAGAASRHSLGASVLGGMLVATMLGIVVVPTLYVIFQRLENRMKSKKHKTVETVINDSEIKS